MGASLSIEEGLLAIDCREQPAFVCLVGEAGKVLVECQTNVLRWYHVAQRLSPELECIQDWHPSAGVSLDSPPLATLLGDIETQSWLIEEANAMLASGSVVSIAVGVAMAARLWFPRHSGSDLLAWMQRVAAGDEPRARAVAWFRGLDESARLEIERAALRETESLARRLPALRDDIARNPSAARESARSWLHRRDDLESLLWLSKCAGDGAALGSVLEDLDRRAAVFHSMWSVLESFADDPRLSNVAWQQPDAWWGLLATG